MSEPLTQVELERIRKDAKAFNGVHAMHETWRDVSPLLRHITILEAENARLREALVLIRRHARHPDVASDGRHVEPMTTLAAIYAHAGRALAPAGAAEDGGEP